MQIDAAHHNGRLEIADEFSISNKSSAVYQQSQLDLLLEAHPGDTWLKRMKDIENQVLSLAEEDLPELSSKQRQHITAFTLQED